MYTLIKTFWKPVVVFLLLIVALSVFGVKQCRSNRENEKQEAITQAAKLQSYKVHYEDSVKTALHKQKLLELDSIKQVEAEKTKVAGLAADYYANEANKLRRSNSKLQNKLDSMIIDGTTPCPEMLEACLETNAGLRSEINQLDSANYNLDKEAEGYSNQLYICEKESKEKDIMIAEKDISIMELKSQIGTLMCYREYMRLNFFQKIFAKRCK